MTSNPMRRLGCLLLLIGMAAASAIAQERVVAPLPSLAPLIERVAPAVVNISIRGTVARQRNLFPDAPSNPFPFGPELFGIEPDQRQFQAAGSGVIVDADEGYILTNHHVIENATELTVSLVDERVFTAEVVGSDADSDLALLRIDGDDLAERVGGDDTVLSRVQLDVDYVALANGYGVEGESVSAPGELAAALGRASKAINEGRPYVVDVKIETRFGSFDPDWFDHFSITDGFSPGG